MKTKLLLTCILVLLPFIYIFSQENSDVYWISFADKNHNTYTLTSPEEFLSERALERRANQGIFLDKTDLPVSKYYTDSLAALGIQVRYTSKWFNGAAIQTTDSILLDTIENYNFITEKKIIRKKILLKSSSAVYSGNFYQYGLGETQISMLNGHILHNQGFHGENMMIAVTDAGFLNVPILPAFDSLFAENRIIITKDFVDGDTSVYNSHTHGKSVLSIIGGNYPNNLVGSAPKADYLLIRTEDGASEQIIEEYNWIAGAELADSMGVDVINVSLGYKNYDTSAWNYSQAQINGKYSPMSIASTIAARKGIIVVVASGNNGDDINPKIGIPADADSILTVGATDSLGNYASFSSIGYSSDGRVKPDIVAQGEATYLQQNDSSITYGNGTSFSTPIITGLVACLWQANPNMNNMEIINAVKESASLFSNPNMYMGYGLPNFASANLYLKNIDYQSFDNENLISVFPNPTTNFLNIEFYSVNTKSLDISIYNLQGQKMFNKILPVTRTSYNTLKINDIMNFSKGYYILNIKTPNNSYSRPFVKQ